MRHSALLPSSRVLQVVGVLIALVGLLGFWWPREPERMVRTVAQQGLVNPGGEDFQLSFVVAGRDFDITSYASDCQWIGGECVRSRQGTFVPSNRTDTILYVNIVGDQISVVAIPRDLYLHDWQTKINAMLLYRGPDGLREAVQDILGVPVDYYAIIDVNIFERIVDALGGIDVNVPYRMYYRDSAAGLLIDLEPGPQHLDGAETAGFVRFRATARGDIDRMDNVKLVVYAVLQRVKELNVRAAGAVPQLLDAYFEQVDTNINLAVLTRLLPRLGNLQLSAIATLPVTASYRHPQAGDVVDYDPQQVEQFLADLFGGTARSFASVPDLTLLVTNRSGADGLEEWMKNRLVALGMAEDAILVRTGDPDPNPTRLLATAASWDQTDYFTGLLAAGRQQIDRLPAPDGTSIDLELVLGADARTMAGWADALPAGNLAAPAESQTDIQNPGEDF